MESIETRERLFKFSFKFSAFLIFVVFFAAFITLFVASWLSIEKFGLKFIVSRDWNPITGRFGALPFICGTIVTSLLALLISLPFSLSVAILLGDFLKGGFLHEIISLSVELLAAIPSVIYGFWGLFVLVPLVRNLEIKLGITPYGVGLFTASLILSIMIIPYSATIARDVISMVPQELKEAAYALGATRFEVIKNVVLPYARSGITAGFLLSLGRALGETMAVTMVIGNSNLLPHSLFEPGNTMASVIANEFTEATRSIYLSSLVEIGFLLLIISAITSFTGKLIIKKLGVGRIEEI